MSKKLKIVSDGTPRGTSVTDMGTGNPLPGAYGFSLSGARMKGAVQAAVFCYLAEVDFEGDADVVQVPPELMARAHEIATRMDSDLVREAFTDLLGPMGQFFEKDDPRFMIVTEYGQTYRQLRRRRSTSDASMGDPSYPASASCEPTPSGSRP